MAYANQPQDLVSRMRRIEEELADLRRKVGLSSAVIRRGGLRLLDDAYFEVVSADDQRVAKIGGLGAFPDGSSQQGTDLRYQNGKAALTIWNAGALDPDDEQFLAVWNDNTIVMSTDANSGFGIARPWLQIPFARTRVSDYASSTSATYESVNESFTPQQHPWFDSRIVVGGSSGTVGDARVTVAGNPVGDPVHFDGTVSTNLVVGFRSARIVQPFGTLTQVALEVRRTAGAGTIGAKIDAWWRQT